MVLMLGSSLIFWSAMVTATSFVKTYWEVVVLQVFKAIGQAGCAPLAAGILSDYYELHTRALAIGIFNWGIPIGQAVTYGPGNYLTDIVGYRWSLFAIGTPGILLGALIILTVKNKPDREINERKSEGKNQIGNETSKILVNPVSQEQSSVEYSSLLSNKHPSSLQPTKSIKSIKSIKQPTKEQSGFMSPIEVMLYFWHHKSLLLLCTASMFRMSSSYIWLFYQNQFFQNYHNLSQSEISVWLSWVPAVGGAIGAFMGGLLSDRFSRSHGASGRIGILTLSIFITIPLEIGILFLPVKPPFAFVMLLIEYLMSGFWVPGCIAVVVHIVHPEIRVASCALWLFVANITGGNATLLEPLFSSIFSVYDDDKRILYTLIVLYPVVTAISALFFTLSWITQKNRNSN